MPRRVNRSVSVSESIIATPSVTDGYTATESETEMETDLEFPASTLERSVSPRRTASSSTIRGSDPIARERSKSLSQHDLFNLYFRKDVIGFRNIDLLRFVVYWQSGSLSK